ncbi:hypothetical protein [Streptomyces sp. NPDC047043]|uniref:hypothetical protein n=1 Tax=Streptomyces sp. NPDC047043 TaxID=3154497 RepID=UPI0033ED09A0
MSTEAQHASTPPRPTDPPRPPHPPATGEDGANRPDTTGTTTEASTHGDTTADHAASAGSVPADPDRPVATNGTSTDRATTADPSAPAWSPWRQAERFEAFRHRPASKGAGGGGEDGADADSSARGGPRSEGRSPSGRGGATDANSSPYRQEAGASSTRGAKPDPVPSPRPGTETGPAASRRPGTEPDADRSPSGSADAPPRFPRLRAPFAGDAFPLTPPPPQASARFPDAPPAAGTGGANRSGTGVPPRPSHRPAQPPRRPDETAQETTTRLRPVPADSPASDPVRRPGATPPPRTPSSAEPVRRPGSAVPPMPETRPGAATPPAAPPRPTSPPADPPRRPAPADAPARPDGPPDAPLGSGVVVPDPALSWSAPTVPGGTPGAGRPVVSFGEPEGYDERARPRPLGGRMRSRTAAVAACVVLGLGLIGGAVTGSWLVGDSEDSGTRDTFATAGSLWHSVPVDRLFPQSVEGSGAGPGGADRTWTRVAVAPDSGCKDAFDPLLKKALAPVGCRRLIRATYTDATQSFVTTVGLLFTKADATTMKALAKRFRSEDLGDRTDLMPRPYAAKGTVAARFGTKQRASWTVSVLTDAPVVVYSVSGWADGRTVDTPQPAEQAMQSGATTAPAQAGLGNEAQGLADRIERALRKDVTSSPSEQPS